MTRTIAVVALIAALAMPAVAVAGGLSPAERHRGCQVGADGVTVLCPQPNFDMRACLASLDRAYFPDAAERVQVCNDAKWGA